LYPLDDLEVKHSRFDVENKLLIDVMYGNMPEHERFQRANTVDDHIDDADRAFLAGSIVSRVGEPRRNIPVCRYFDTPNGLPYTVNTSLWEFSENVLYKRNSHLGQQHTQSIKRHTYFSFSSGRGLVHRANPYQRRRLTGIGTPKGKPVRRLRRNTTTTDAVTGSLKLSSIAV
jgi:hypothetical protein